MRKVIYALIVAALIAGAGLLLAAGKTQAPLVFSPWQMTEALWVDYKKGYLASDFRTVDPSRNGQTTSEGQSYAMLRAVFMADEPTFDGVWQWTQKNLQQRSGVFAWLWGERPDGSYGILMAENGQNSASDADTDIALALILAYGRWQNPSYLSDAKQIINGIWNEDVVEVGGKPYLAADDVEKTSQSPFIVVNPSYFNPAAYELFAEADPGHPWSELRDDSYALLEESMKAPLGASQSDNLPPDWALMNRTTGVLQAPEGSTTQTADFGYDALRVPFRLALDWEWFGDQRDLTLLGEMSFLKQTWRKDRALGSVYGHGGEELDSSETPAMYGGTLGYFMLADPEDAKSVYEYKLLSLYDTDTNSWRAKLSYYDANWAWFGIALYNGLLPNLTKNIPLD